jgi:site-specific recombinase XerD
MLSYIDSYAKYEQVVLGHRKSTVDKYVRSIRQFHDWLKEEGRDTNPDAITTEDIKDFMTALVFKYKNTKNSTRATKLSSLSAFFNYLISIKLLAASPVQDVPSPKVIKGMPGKFTTKELALIFAAVSMRLDKRIEIRNHAILKVMYASAMRVSELCGLTVGDLNDTGRYIRVQVMGKGGKPRMITLRTDPAAALRKWFAIRMGINTDHAALFIADRSSAPLKPEGMNDVLKKYAGIVGVKDAEAFVHKMRATCLADMYDQQMNKCGHCGAAISKEDIYTIAAFAGWEDPKTAQAYINISETVQKRGISDGRFKEIGKLSERFKAELQD